MANPPEMSNHETRKHQDSYGPSKFQPVDTLPPALCNSALAGCCRPPPRALCALGCLQPAAWLPTRSVTLPSRPLSAAGPPPRAPAPSSPLPAAAAAPRSKGQQQRADSRTCACKYVGEFVPCGRSISSGIKGHQDQKLYLSVPCRHGVAPHLEQGRGGAHQADVLLQLPLLCCHLCSRRKIR